MVTNIYRCEDGLVGISGFKNNRSKKRSSQYNITAWAEEYIEVPTIRYSPKYHE